MIELKNVCFSYIQGCKENGLHNINLTIRDGEVVLLCGESGCGKTTLTRLINGLIPNYYEGSLTGEVMLNGRAVNNLPLYETAKMVGSVFQNPRSQFFNVDTTSELAFGCENMGLPIEEIQRRIDETVCDFKIETLMGRSIFKLSGGEKQKIACASVSTCHPDIFVLDEPSSNLDTSSIEDLRELIVMWKSKGKTIIIAEHRLYFLRELADRILYMKEGRIKEEFTSREMKAMSLSRLSGMGLRSLFLYSLSKCKSGLSQKQGYVSLSGFVFSYKNQHPAIEIHNLSIPEGGIIAVIGHNGAGKSTFARCLCGLEKSCKGVMSVGGKSFNGRNRLKHFYMVMQDVNHQLFTESVLDEILLSMDKEDSQRAEDILNSLDLLSFKDMHPMSLSGGQKQRVAIASAVASQKEFILFDEPTSGLDFKHMQQVSDNLKQLNQMGKTLFIISHDLELILRSCTHVLHFEKGRVIDNYPIDDSGEKKVVSFFVKASEERGGTPDCLCV
ncbi:energy-coupling factor transport system ATP-binding protein [Anaerobacterium chartisolvens]|uniref:Energy-coupling factor transport system ATP-binding protein n=1 Tax=Anaerobacterium chartisolvens TaxID=1297424 RepID=A0A369BDC7_9FIRM|nr:ABC transporter ATP-binding protein [Anaerobacterium chartisolvens]RCX19401.1 energy-coupling factor transport system ATP-binding protein [Anaerobacterium chartisolvens]